MSTNLNNHITITVDRIPEVLDVFLPTGSAVFMQSDPGIGKSEQAESFARSIGAEFITVVASLLERFDLSGLPYIHKDGDGRIIATRFAPHDLIRDLSIEHNPDGAPVLLYLNELNAAPDSVMPVFYRLLQERAVNDMHLRDNVYILADGNPPSAQSAGRRMQLALRRRFVWFSVETSVDVWSNWAYEKGIDPMIISFFQIGDFARYLNNFRTVDHRTAVTYASPAGWAKLSRALPRIRRQKDESLRLALIAGCVGMEAGVAFAGYLAKEAMLKDQLKLDEVLANPTKEALYPKDAELLGILCSGMLLAARENAAHVDAVSLAAATLFRSKTTFMPEFGAFTIRSLMGMLKQDQKAFSRFTRSKAFSQLTSAIGKDRGILSAMISSAAA